MTSQHTSAVLSVPQKKPSPSAQYYIKNPGRTGQLPQNAWATSNLSNISSQISSLGYSQREKLPDPSEDTTPSFDDKYWSVDDPAFLRTNFWSIIYWIRNLSQKYDKMYDTYPAGGPDKSYEQSITNNIKMLERLYNNYIKKSPEAQTDGITTAFTTLEKTFKNGVNLSSTKTFVSQWDHVQDNTKSKDPQGLGQLLWDWMKNSNDIDELCQQSSAPERKKADVIFLILSIDIDVVNNPDSLVGNIGNIDKKVFGGPMDEKMVMLALQTYFYYKNDGTWDIRDDRQFDQHDAKYDMQSFMCHQWGGDMDKSWNWFKMNLALHDDIDYHWPKNPPDALIHNPDTLLTDLLYLLN